jgi:tyrosinase
MGRLFSLFVLVQAAVASLHGAHHHQHNEKRATPEQMAAHLESVQSELHKRANNIAITGVTGTIAPRLEIRQLRNNGDQWNLYLLGMQRFMNKPKNDRLSYYAIAGVHGTPFVSWNNFPTPLVNEAGFCPHGNILFSTWHRPYLAVFEQAWYLSVQEVINTFPADQQQRWRNAANGLRMPYWDWAVAPPSGQDSTPTLIRDQQVTVTTPNGQQTIPNPLYKYSWGTVPAEIGWLPWNRWPETLRRPWPNPTRSNNNEVASLMNARRINLRDRVYGLFMSGASAGDIGSSAVGVRTNQNGGNVDSLESIHDIVHVTVGGESEGHMYYLDTSSFDPIFWLHHTNVDRLFAMYQVVQPTTGNTLVTPGNINSNMAQWNAGEPKNSFTPLKPFTKNTNGDYFTSEDIRNTRVLGYVYPETNGNPTANSVRSAVNSLYGPNAPRRKRNEEVPHIGGSTNQYEGRPFREGDYHTVLSVVANKFAIDGSYSIDCFLSSNSTKNLTAVSYDSPNYIGTYAVLGMKMKSATNGSSYPLMTEGCLPLTTALQGKQVSGELKEMSPEGINAYLKDNLKCRIIGPGGVELTPESVPALHLFIKTAPIKPAPSYDELPSVGDYKVLEECTEKLPAGKPYTYPPQSSYPTVPSSDGPTGSYPPGYKPAESYPAGYTPVHYPSSPSEHYPSAPAYPSHVSPPYPTGTVKLPWDTPEAEDGYCVRDTTIHFVDESGKFLYAEKQY